MRWLLALAVLVSTCAYASVKETIISYIASQLAAPVKVTELNASYRGFDASKDYEMVSYRINPSGRAWFLFKDGARSFWVQAKFSVQKMVVVSKGLIDRGEIIASDKVQTKLLWLSPSKAGKVLGYEDVVGKVATRRIQPGAIITSGMVKKPLAVRRGELVKFLLREGAVEIEGVARAMRNASVGEIVELKNLSSGRIFSGEVIGEGRVVVR